MNMIAAVAGTFNIIHSGHRKLIEAAFSAADEVLVGITSDRMALSGREDAVPLEIRKAEMESYLATFGKPWKIMIIDDVCGPREMMDPADYLVVSEETIGGAEIVNRDRIARGVKPLDVIVIPVEYSFKGSKISASAILKGEYARDGSEGSVDIAVGSLNHVKAEAVRGVMERIFGNVRITSVDADSAVPPQPFEEETAKGAVNRARNALGDHEMSVGIEAGVFEKEDGLYDYQYCAILDRNGKLTIGTGSGFRYPDAVADLVRSGCTVGDAMHKIYGKENIGKGQGAVGFLSKGLIDRKTLTEQSVIAAMIPRLWGREDA